MITPCIGICELEGDHCIGCGRSLKQIENWSRYTDNKKQEIMKQSTENWLQENGFKNTKRGLWEKEYEDGGPFVELLKTKRGNWIGLFIYDKYNIDCGFRNEIFELSELEKFVKLCEQFVVNEVNYEG